MNDANPVPEQADIPPASAAVLAEPVGSPPQQRSSKAALVLSLIAICLSLGFAATAFFLWNQLQQVVGQQAGVAGQVDERLQPLRASVEQLTRTFQTENDKLDRRFQLVDAHAAEAAEEQERIQHRVAVLGALMGRSEQGWGLAEVDYLLGIANQRLQLQRDTKTAEVALQSADARLRDLADPHFTSVREQIARDLEALAVVPAVDVDGISLTLGAWLERIDKLAVAGTRYQQAEIPDSAGSSELKTVDDWKQLPRLIWTSLRGLFQLREHDQPVKPMLAPEREYFLRENLRLQLSAARLALLRDDSGQYQAALGTSREWLKGYFAQDNSDVNELLTTLNELLEINIRPDLPSLAASLRLLRQQMKLSEPGVIQQGQQAPAESGETKLETATGSVSAAP